MKKYTDEYVEYVRNTASLYDLFFRNVPRTIVRTTSDSQEDEPFVCPFCDRTTIKVSDEKGFYYCFTCQAKGDAITFAMEVLGLSFDEAIERLER